MTTYLSSLTKGACPVIKPTLWIQPGVVIIYGANLDAAPHSHHAIQLIWPRQNSLCKLNEKHIVGLTIIGSKVVHQLQMSEGWVLLIEPKSELGQELSKKLEEKPCKTLDLPLFNEVKPSDQTDDINKFLAPLFQQLTLKNQALVNSALLCNTLPFTKSTVEDKRIQQLLAKLNQCLHGNCIKPSHWRASQVASQLALSESRFLHLFRQELGIAWRPYLLWRRMMCAIQALINNKSATEAAHLAGFSDSAHLSRTFRNTFGMTIRQALTLFKKVS
ncbi:MAG: helix-turn-helix transcriptional regulator [Colwellia sp.]|nr:helix-turn-helix transcriptional regulator [Colwellia sp.]